MMIAFSSDLFFLKLIIIFFVIFSVFHDLSLLYPQIISQCNTVQCVITSVYPKTLISRSFSAPPPM